MLDAEAAARSIPIEQGAAGSGGASGSGSKSATSASISRVKCERGGQGVDLTMGMVARSSVDPTVLEMFDLTADADALIWTAKKRNASAPIVYRL